MSNLIINAMMSISSCLFRLTPFATYEPIIHAYGNNSKLYIYIIIVFTTCGCLLLCFRFAIEQSSEIVMS